MKPLASLALSALFVLAPAQAAVSTDVPDEPDAAKTYLIYLHGRIVENAGPRPLDPRFGVYDYAAVLEALASRGAEVVSAQRPAKTDPNEYAGIVVGQIERLLRGGVPPERIVVVGFSKGGDIAIRTSSFLRRPQVRYVLMAACWDRPNDPQLRLTGQVLSIRETSDTLAPDSCRPLARHDERPRSFEEITISTGRSHGAFYTPLQEWVGPVLDWIEGERPPASGP